VTSCHRCNSRKNDSLAGLDFLEELIERNKTYQDKISELKKSLLQLGADEKWEQEIFKHYRNCEEYGFTPVKLP
jgi:hypothetical protein